MDENLSWDGGLALPKEPETLEVPFALKHSPCNNRTQPNVLSKHLHAHRYAGCLLPHKLGSK